MYKSIFLVLIMLLAVGCIINYPSYGIPRSPDALQVIQKYQKINVALVVGRQKQTTTRTPIPGVSALDKAIPFTLDASEVGGGNQTLSPNVPFTNNFTQYLQTEVEGLEIQTHKGLDLLDWKNRELKGLWIQSDFNYGVIVDLFDHIYTLRGYVYLVAMPSKKILWQGVCRKWVYVEEKYMSIRKEVLKIKLNSFIKSCSSNLIAQWNGSGIKNTYILIPECVDSQHECRFHKKRRNGVNRLEGLSNPTNELNELTLTEEAELKKLL